MISSAIEQAAATGQGLASRQAHGAAAILSNGLGRYEEANAAAREAAGNRMDHPSAMLGLPELVEGAARSGDIEVGRDALDRLSAMTHGCGTDYPLGIEARSRALLSDGADAEALYREAIERLGRTRLRPELARAHLVYGEWLRRESRRVDAREQLRTAHDLFAKIGMEAFGERARRELLATGETGPQAERRDAGSAHAAGVADRPPRGRREDEPRDRRPAVPEPADGRVASPQGLYEARHRLPTGPPGRARAG